MSHALLARLRGADPAERRAACEAAARDPSPGPLLPALGRALGDADRAVARAAFHSLVELGRSHREADRVLDEALRSDSPVRRVRAALAWAELAPPTPKLLPALVEGFSSPQGDLRWSAARVLVDAGRLHAEVFRLLLGLTRRENAAPARRMALFCLRELAPERPEAAQALLAASRDDDLALRRGALAAMAALDDPPPEVGARLAEVFRSDPDGPSQRLAASALGELGARAPAALPEGARAALRAARDGASDPDLSRAADRALERIRTGGSPAARRDAGP